MEFYIKLKVEIDDDSSDSSETSDDVYERAVDKIKGVVTKSLIGFTILDYSDDGDEIQSRIKHSPDVLSLTSGTQIIDYLKWNYEDDGAWKENDNTFDGHNIELCLLELRSV